MSEAAVVERLKPIEFARDILQVELWSKQEEVLSALVENRRVAVKSGNGLGKGYCAAVAALWFLYCHDPAIVLTTAPTFRQVRHILWRQIRGLYRRASDVLGGKMLDTRWELAEDRYAIGLSADTADQFQGFHSPNMFIIVDEAEGVSDEIYEAIEAVMTSAAPRLLLIGNPTGIDGAFRRAFYEERAIYYTMTISALDSPNLIAGEVVIPGLATADWVEERRLAWGEEDPIFRSRILGEFSENSDDTLIRLSDIEAAARRQLLGPAEYALPDHPGQEEVVMAVDVARFGSDRSVILYRRGNRVEDICTFRKLDTMQFAARIAAAIKQHGPARVYIDEIGVGAGVVDRLKEQGFPVQGVNVALRAKQAGQFTNLRAEGYWRLRELFESGAIAIPNDSELIGELAALRYHYDKLQRLSLESKDGMRERGLPSPDKADALMLSFVERPPRPRIWT